MTRAVLFDFDLTLADSTAAIVHCMHHSFDQMSLPRPTALEIASTIGLPLPKAFALLTREQHPQSAARFLQGYHARADEVMTGMTTLLPFAAETARALKQQGLRTGIVSTKLRFRIEATLAYVGLADAFDVVVGGNDVSEHKPHPEGLHLAMKHLDVTGDAALFVGDHPVDAEAASRAGVDFVAVLTGMAAREVFAGHHVLSFLPSLEQLPQVILDRAPRSA